MPGWLTLANALAIITAAGGIGQVVVAYIAVTLARGANNINRRAYFQQRLSADLAEVLSLARDTRRKYKKMFNRFHTLTQKQSSRAAWLEAGEDVGQSLRELAQLDAQVQATVDAWLAVENTPDRHAGNDKLECSATDRDHELRLPDLEGPRSAGGGFRRADEIAHSNGLA